jgi:hypothetical protein
MCTVERSVGKRHNCELCSLPELNECPSFCVWWQRFSVITMITLLFCHSYILCERFSLDSTLLNRNFFWSDFDRASSLICGDKMPTICNRCFLLQILLLAQHVSGTIMPIIRSSRVLYSWLPPVVFGGLCVSGLRAAARKPNTQPSAPHHTDNLKAKHQIRQAATTCVILSSSWWWA